MNLRMFVLLMLVAINAFAQKPKPALPPLDRIEVLALLDHSHITKERAIAIIGQRGIAFDPSGEYLEIVKDVGVDEAVLKAITQAARIEPSSKPQPTPAKKPSQSRVPQRKEPSPTVQNENRKD